MRRRRADLLSCLTADSGVFLKLLQMSSNPESTEATLPDERVVTLLADLRSRLHPVVARLLPEDHGARSLARFLGLDRMTGWRCWTMAHEADPGRGLRGMPGRRGWDRILRSLEEKGATAEELAGILAAIRAFGVHLGEHGLVWSDLGAGSVESREPSSGGEDIIEARRAAHAGAVGLYGVRARLLLASYLVAPGAEDGTLSLGSFGLVDGLQRTRPGDAWPILQRPVMEEDGSVRCRHVSCGDVRGFPNLIARVSSSGLGTGVLERRRTGPLTEVVMFTGDP